MIYNFIGKGLYINDVILFWAILDTPLPPVIMSSFDMPPTPPDDVIYVQNNSKNVEDKIKSTKENERFGPLHLKISFIYMNTLPYIDTFYSFHHGFKQN